MLTLLRTLSIGYFSQHRTRSVLVVLSIALGVATLVATQALNRSLKVGVENGVNPLASLADQASEAGRQAIGQASEYIENVAPQAKQVASNLYDQSARSGQYVRQYAEQEPLTAMLVAGAIGFALGYLIRGR